MSAKTEPTKSTSKQESKPWLSAMKQVHIQFTGRHGTFTVFGDSISDTNVYMAPFASEEPIYANTEQQTAFNTFRNYARLDVLQKWKGAAYGNLSRMRIQWAREGLETWLQQLQPEVCIFMFGSNNVKDESIDTYEQDLRACLEIIQNHGCICILSTIPPYHEQLARVHAINDIIRRVACDYRLMLQDFFQEIMIRRPNDWSGKLEQFGVGDNYDVNTLLARDGIHPSNPSAYGPINFTDEGLMHSGYSLRNYLGVRDFAKVISEVLT